MLWKLFFYCFLNEIQSPVLNTKRRKRSQLTKNVSKHNKRYKFAGCVKDPIQSLLIKKSRPRENKKIPFAFENREPQSQDPNNNVQMEKKYKQNAMPKMNLEEVIFNNCKYYKSAIEKLIQNNPDVFKPHKTAVKGEISQDKNIIQPHPINFSDDHKLWAKATQYAKQFDPKPFIHPHDKRNINYEDEDGYRYVVNRDDIVDVSFKAPDTEEAHKTKLLEIEPSTINLKHNEENPLLKTIEHGKLFHPYKIRIHPYSKWNNIYEEENGYVVNRDAVVDVCFKATDTANLEEAHKPNRIEIKHSTIKLKHNEENPLVKAKEYAKQFDPNEPLIDPYDKRNIKYEAEDGYNANRDAIVDNSFITPGIVNLEEAHKPLEFHKQSEYVLRNYEPFENGISVDLQPSEELVLSKLLENKAMKNFESLKNPNALSSNKSRVFSVQLKNKPLITEKSSSTRFCNEPFPDTTLQQPLSDSRGTLKESQNLLHLRHQIHQVTVVQNTESLQITCDVLPAKDSIEIDESAVHQPDVEYKEGSSEVEQENQSSPRQENEKLITQYKVTLILPKNQLDTHEVRDLSDSMTQKPEKEVPLSELLKRIRLRNQAEHLAQFRKTLETDLDLKSKSDGQCPPGKPLKNYPCPHTVPPSPPPPVSYPPQPCKPICTPPKSLPKPTFKKPPCCPKFDFTKHFPTYMINGIISLVQQRIALGKALVQNQFVIINNTYQRNLFGCCSAEIYRPNFMTVRIMSGSDSSITNEENIENNTLARGCRVNDPWSPNLWWPELKKQANKPLACFKEGRLFLPSKALPGCKIYLCRALSKRKNCFSIADIDNPSWSGENIRNYLLNFNV